MTEARYTWRGQAGSTGRVQGVQAGCWEHTPRVWGRQGSNGRGGMGSWDEVHHAVHAVHGPRALSFCGHQPCHGVHAVRRPRVH